MFWVMSPVCWAFATAVELSLSTLSATAALIGAATFALMSDIAARSGSGSPASLSSSSRDSARYSCGSPVIVRLLLRVPLVDRRLLHCARIRRRVVGQDVRRDRRVHGDSDVRV